MRLLLIGLAMAVAIASSAAAAPRRPQAAVSVLIDFSETWLNPEALAQDRRVLEIVGRAIVAAAPKLSKPLMVRYHAIGADSLGQAPICTVDYRKSLFGIRAADLVTSEDEFARYLTLECPRFVTSRRPQVATELSAAVVSAARATAMAGPAIHRTMIILSDFKEETLAPVSLDSVALRGTRVLMLYRTLPEDRRYPAGLDQRIDTWKRKLRARGARVAAFDENAAASAADLTALITDR